MREIIYNATKTANQFHADDSMVRCLMGPVGSGKSSACCIEILKRAMQQDPAPDGKRYSRWVVVRNSYPELQSTTIKDWTEWFPEDIFGRVYQTSPIEQIVEFDDVHLTMWFISLDNERDAKKFRGLRITGVWLNEASELPRIALDMAIQRKGRYPDKLQGKPSWSGVIMDTNPPDADHWIYNLFEKEQPEDYSIYKYEPALIKNGDKYSINPDADYVQNLPDPNYYHTLVKGQSEEWIKVFVMGQYGTVETGRRVYPEFNDRIHTQDYIPIDKNVPLMLSWDFGLTPACILTQQMPSGQIKVIKEFQGFDTGIASFAENVVLTWINANLPLNEYKNWSIGQADPSGISKEGDDMSSINRLNALSSRHPAFNTNPEGAMTNNPDSRINSVSIALNRLIDGQPGLIIDPKNCPILHRGFLGKYAYKRILVAGKDRYKDKPDKNEVSHIHDALQYACLQYAGQQKYNDESIDKFSSYILDNPSSFAIGGSL